MISGPSMLMPLLSEQVAVFLRAMLIGMVFGALYDVFRITRVIVGVRYSGVSSHEKWQKKIASIQYFANFGAKAMNTVRTVIVIAGDILFFILCGIGISVFIYRYCSGIVRLYVFIGCFLGFAAYYNSVGRIVIYLSDMLVFFILSAIKYLLRFILSPFVFIAERIRKNIKKKKERSNNESG